MSVRVAVPFPTRSRRRSLWTIGDYFITAYGLTVRETYHTCCGFIWYWRRCLHSLFKWSSSRNKRSPRANPDSRTQNKKRFPYNTITLRYGVLVDDHHRQQIGCYYVWIGEAEWRWLVQVTRNWGPLFSRQNSTGPFFLITANKEPITIQIRIRGEAASPATCRTTTTAAQTELMNGMDVEQVDH